MHKNSHDKMKWFKNNYLKTSRKLDILDVSSSDDQRHDYSDIFDEKNWTYTRLNFQDSDNSDIIITDVYNWFEVEDNSYDVVISCHLFEHLEFFWLTMSQIERVMRPGGYVCIIAPSAGPKHGGNIPNCYRFNEEGMKAMAKYVDLEITYTSIDNNEDAKPWNDACLVAHKSTSVLNKDTQELESRLNNLENKLDSILEKINK